MIEDDTNQRQQEPEAPADRGQHATTPAAIPLAGWKDVALRVFHAFGDNNLSLIAAGVSFYALLSLFPAIGAFVAIYGLFLEPHEVVQQLNQLKGVVPPDVLETLTSQMRTVSSGSGAKLTTAAVISLLVALWGARMGTNALMSALNVVYHEREKRGFIKLTLVSSFFTLALILGLISIALLAVAVPVMFEVLGTGGWLLVFGHVIGIALAAVLLVFGLAAFYRWAPSRSAPRWRWVAVGTAVVTVFWVLGSLVFSLYVTVSDRYSAVYGSLGSVIILLTWIYITVLIMLVGGELNAQLEHQTAEDTTIKPELPIGQRGAFVADNVASGCKQELEHRE